ncbi:biotin--[acetyl-CoA-carboxylase] ligase [Candidatus Woesearchaeota archaeon]|nr:biotin--[acetyl-CoA-carboxylase] ligase [Candidatus Woesearchaeota archaeon]
MNYKLFHFNSLTSTQDKAKEFAKKGLSSAVIISDVQTRGRGRFKRKWHSSKGGLWMSVLLKPKNAQHLQYLTFAAAVSVVNAIKKITGINVKIKWPNDVHYKGKKLCGILTEGIFGKENHVVVGIGLNVNQDKFPEDIKNIATSLKLIKNETYAIKKISLLILEEFSNIYEKIYDKNKFNGILEIWKENCDTLNKNIKVTTGKKKVLYGQAVGVAEDCSLLLKLNNKKTIKIIEGDVHIRY